MEVSPSLQTSLCQKGCLLEGIAPAKLPPYRVYSLKEQIAPRESVFLICYGPVGCLWGGAKGCLEILGPGEIWESWECLHGVCEAWALGEVKGRWIEQKHWLELLRHPLVEERFVNYLRRRSQRQHEWQLVLARGSVRARVARQLIGLAERFGERDARTGEVFVPISLTQAQQAQLCGAGRSQVVKALQEFEGKRWLVCSRRKGFWVRDERALQQQSREGL